MWAPSSKGSFVPKEKGWGVCSLDVLQHSWGKRNKTTNFVIKVVHNSGLSLDGSNFWTGNLYTFHVLIFLCSSWINELAVQQYHSSGYWCCCWLSSGYFVLYQGCVWALPVSVTSRWILIGLKCYSSQFCVIFSFTLSVSFYEKGRWRSSAAAWICISPFPFSCCHPTAVGIAMGVIAWPAAGMCHRNLGALQPVLNLLSCVLLWLLPCQFVQENIGGESPGNPAGVKVNISPALHPPLSTSPYGKGHPAL